MKKKVAIIGAGPAGLAAAYEFYKQKKLKDFNVEVFESDSQVGGISKTLLYKGYRFDLGGHRFYSKFNEINNFYKDFLGKNMLKRKRLSRIYYNNKFYNYPLSARNVFSNLGFSKSFIITISWLFRRLNQYENEKTYDKWVSNRFGDEIFNMFFKSYTENLWGIPASRLSADWAAQRIQNYDFVKAVINALFGINPGSVKTIIDSFYYPKYGPGMLYDEMKRVLQENGVVFHLNTEIVSIVYEKGKVRKVIAKNRTSGKSVQHELDFLISSMPLNKLVISLGANNTLKTEINKLKFRNFLTVNMIIKSNPFPDNWIYIHNPGVKVLRMQNFRNWSPYMAKKGSENTPIAMEYFAYESDKIWNAKDEEIINKAKKEIESIGLAKKNSVIDAFVHRVRNAYPVYDSGYGIAVKAAKDYFERFFQLICLRTGRAFSL